VALAEDISLTIDVKSTGRNHFGIDRNVGVWKPDSVEDEFQITFAPEMSWLLVGLQVSCHVRAPWKGDTPKFLQHADMTKYGIAYAGRLRGKIRLVECATQQRSGRYLNVLRISASLHNEKQKW
jgi:hypothetical protein